MRAAIWARVSTERQETDNQLPQLRAIAERRGLEVVEVYTVEASAWKGKHRAQLDQAVRDARVGRYTVLLVWALDRLTREGPLETLQVVDRFPKVGVQVVSQQEPWTEATGELRDLMLAIVGWVARFESTRRSERTKAGLARVRAEGKAIGRQAGSKDRQKRRRSGYVARWESEQERQRARERALARVNKGDAANRLAVNSAEAVAEAG
jgi:putative DNA-invertase from lambdoid prophage Rac